MKLLIALAAVLIALHFLWSGLGIPTRTVFKAWVKRHAFPVLAILLVLFALLIAAFYSGSLNLL